MKLYMIRHGQTEWNKEKRLQGRVDIPLNAYGIQLAEETRDGLLGVRFDIAFTSPLKRAKKTAQILLEGQDVKMKGLLRLVLGLMRDFVMEKKIIIYQIRIL